MNAKLRDEDAQALDLLLDRTRVAAGDALVFSTTHASQDRVRGAERVLTLLQMLPAADPPADLLANTLRRIGEAADEPAVRNGIPAIIASPFPHA